MRLSVLRDDDPGFSPRACAALVFIDGRLLQRCVTADEEAGLAIVVRCDRGVVQRDSAGKVLTEERRGKVEIRFPQQSAALQ